MAKPGQFHAKCNYYCYSIVFGPNFREGRKFSGRGESFQGGANCLRGRPLPPCGRKPALGTFYHLHLYFLTTASDFYEP